MRWLIIFMLFLFQFLSGCSGGQGLQNDAVQQEDGYDRDITGSAFDAMVEAVLPSVKLINCVAHYRTYQFAEPLAGTPDIENASEVTLENETRSGTATLVYYDGSRLAVLTCAHVVDMPDTIIEKIPRTGAVSRIRIRQSLRMYITDYNSYRSFEIIALDREKDLALLGKDHRPEADQELKVLGIGPGKSKDLFWGSRVYLAGYPKGHLMLHRGIVSLRADDPRKNFLVDTPFNRGFSGGIVLAMRGGPAHPEWVGICTSVSADYEDILVPEKLTAGNDRDLDRDYEGPVFIENRGTINYGVTYVTSIDRVMLFFDESDGDLKAAGYDPELLFTR